MRFSIALSGKELQKRQREKQKAKNKRQITVMLKKEEEVRSELEGKMLSNVTELVLPYLEKLRMTQPDARKEKFIDIMESNLNRIVSPFGRKLSSRFLGLTPGEIQVANLVRHGNTTKETAKLLSLSVRTIAFQRANIRKKIGIKHKKASLRSILLSFE